MCYHYHITIKDIDAEQLKQVAKELKAKPTTIDLYNNVDHQQDRMITKYAKTYQEMVDTVTIDSVYLKLHGYTLSRLKVEQVFKELPTEIIGEYLEVHIKVTDEAVGQRNGFSLSKNPVEGRRFYNCRIKHDMDLPWYRTAIEEIPHKISVQYEAVIIDSNSQVDAWWA